MSKHDLQARPIYHRIRDSIEAHLTIVLAALAVSEVDQDCDRLVDPEVRQDHPPLPHHHQPGRRPRLHRRRPGPSRARRRALCYQAAVGWPLNEPTQVA
jgi:hypothetical protein